MRLEETCLDHFKAFLEAVQDYQTHEPERMPALFGGHTDWSQKGFAAFVRDGERQKMDWRPKANKTSVTRYVLLDPDNRICGFGQMRFPLNPKLEQDGGNLVFDVPPSLRRQGYGALTLNRMLFEAVRAGLARALVTCAAENIGARRAIEKNRGVLSEPVKGDTLRFWIHFR